MAQPPGHQPGYGQMPPHPYAAPKQPAARKKSSGVKTGCMIAGGCGLVFVAAVGGIAAIAIGLTEPPREAAHAFMGEIRKSDYDGAFAMTSKQFRTVTDQDAFDQLRSAPWMLEIQHSDDATFHSTNVHNDRACLKGTLSPSDGTVYFTMRKESNDWVVEAISRGGHASCN